MAELKTKKTTKSVTKYLNTIENEQKRTDSQELLKIFTEVTGEKATLWGNGIVGFGTYHYKSERSSQEGDWPLTGFAPRKQNLTIYIMPGFKQYQQQLKKIGKYKNSVSCLYIKKLSDIDTAVLKEMIKLSLIEMQKRYG